MHTTPTEGKYTVSEGKDLRIKIIIEENCSQIEEETHLDNLGSGLCLL